jgi:6-pyruvoyltetrahydropterin/6-carboxytetrahydropterin synthase
MARQKAQLASGTVYLSRRYRFVATHRLYADELSEAANQEIFGKCANPNGHGHNYQFYITIAGQIDPVTGMSVDLGKLDEVVRRRVVALYDHRHLNLDVEDYMNEVPTAENIVRRIWERLEGKIPGAKLHKVRLVETRDNAFEYTGGK